MTGQNDAAMTCEPYLSTVRSNPQAGKIIATTLDYPMIMHTFGCTPKFIADNPKAVQAIADSYFEAVAMIAREPAKSFEIMGADAKQTGAQFEASQKYLRWQDNAANQKFFAGGFLLASIAAVPLGILMGAYKPIEALFEPFVVRALPAGVRVHPAPDPVGRHRRSPRRRGSCSAGPGPT